MSDTLEIFGRTYPAAEGIKAYDSNGNLLTFTRDGGGPTLQSKTAAPTESVQTIIADTGYDGLSSVEVGAISSTYVGSGINQNDSNDLTVSGATVTAPAGFYSSNATKTVTSGTEGTPIAIKGAVSNHQVSVTPSVTNTTGYIAGGTKTGTAVTITASELTSGNKAITDNGNNIDVVEYSTVSVNVPKHVVIKSQNLHDSSEDVANTYIAGSTETAYNGWTSTGYISVKPNTYYRVKNTPGNNYNAFYKSDKTSAKSSVSIPASSNNDDGYILIKTTSDTAYIRMSGASSGVANYEIYEVEPTFPTGTMNIINNGLYNVSDFESANVNVESEDFIITLSYNSTTEMWEPDCTYSSILAAYNNNKNIIFYIGTSDGYADGYIHPVRLNVLYRVYEDYYDSSTESNGFNTTFYVYDSSGLTNEGNCISYDTYDADTVASSVPSGNIFYNSTGRVVGTAPSRTSSDLTVSGATVTAPSGFYSANATKTVASGSATTPATTITANPSISVSSSGLITATASATQSITPTVSAGYVSSGTSGTVTVSGSNTSQLTTQAGSTITPTESVQTAVASGKYTTGDVKIGAISSTYVGSGITQNDSDDLTVSGATVTAPAGYYATSASKSVASGTAGTPSASKGTVSNHSISVTPSVTNTTGYITGGTKTGTAVTVTASELASGNKSISSNGTNIDVVGYSTVSVSISPNLQAKTNISPTTSSQTIEPDSGYDGLSSVQINAMPSMTLPTSTTSSGSGTTKATIGRSTSDQYINIPTGYNSSAANYKISAVANMTLPTAASSTSSGTSKATIGRSTSAQYINIPTGYNATASYYTISATPNMTLPTAASSTSSGTSKATIGRSTSAQYINIPTGYNDTAVYYTISAVANGTEGTPTATKGTVSNHQVSITPSVTNTAGYISGGIKTGTAVTVTASELASGNKEITENGTNIDVVGYSTVSVDVSTSNWDLKVSQNITIVADNPNYFIVSPYTEGFHENETYRVTWGNETYICQTKPDTTGFSYDGYYIGNSAAVGGENTGEPFLIYQRTANQLAGGTSEPTGTKLLVLEKQVSGSVFINKTITANGNYFPNDDNADAYSSVIVAIPFSTITVSSSNPTGGANGDIWIKTT